MSTVCQPGERHPAQCGVVPAGGLAAAARGTRASDTTQETERITFHVERRWIEAIRRQADLDGLTITQVVNQAFRQHFDSQ